MENIGIEENKPKRGFAKMDPERQREIASLGGKAAHEKGTAHRFTSEQAKEAGRKGGQKLAQNREYMKEIGQRGGQKVSQNREHMKEIGKRGGRRKNQGAPTEE